MKKILDAAMAVLIAAAMSGCGSTADEQLIEDISEDTSIAAETEASEAAETSEETTAETDTSVEDTIPGGIVHENSQFPVGSWVNTNGTENYFYVFNEDSQFDIGLETHNILGKYTFEDDLLTLIFDIEFHDGSTSHAEYAFYVREEGNGYRLSCNPSESTAADLQHLNPTDEDTSGQELLQELSTLFADYESGRSVFLRDPDAANEPRLAQQEDLLGAWVIPVTDSSITDLDASILGEGIMIFTSNAVKAFYEDEYIDINYTIKDGRPVPSGEIDPYISYDDSTYLTISGNTLYSNTEDNEPGAAYRYEHEPVALNYFDGEYISVFCGGEDIGSVIIENGAGTSEEDDLEIRLSLKGDTVSLALNGEEDEFSYYIIETDYQERYIYFVNDNTIVILLKDIDEE